MATLRSPFTVLATVAVALVALAALAVGAAAQTVAEVQVRDNVYVGPDGSSTTRVTAGNIVRWRWVGDNQHTVTSLPTSAMSFDSDDECPGDDRGECRTKGNVFDVRFDEPGTYRYVCKVHGVLGMTGTIEVAPRDDDGDNGDGSAPPPPGDPTGDQPDDDQPPSDDGDNGDGSGETDDGGSGDQTDGSNGSDSQTAPPRRRAAGQSAPRFVPGDEEVEGDPDDGPDPDVAPPDQDFSPFPSPPPADASEPSDEATEEMAVAIPGPDGPNRNLLIGIATGLLALTGGSVLKVLLAAPTP